ncbi:hypothetical protein GCK32_001889 [Trichostrongylus colubriformis]|uniref:Uncharacterized protein n=1 Tax=Trichostrongylus colubriformis TaxID=6319 RepID=A0AAN8EZD6_TRICO
MMLFVMLCFLVHTHGYSRNQDPTTVPTSEPRRDASTHARRPAEEYNVLDDLSRHVFRDTISNLQVFVEDSQQVLGAFYDLVGGTKTRIAAKANLIDGWFSVPESVEN